MDDYEPTNPHKILPAGATTSSASAELSASAPTAKQARLRSARRWLANRRRRWVVVAAALMCGAIGLSLGLVASRSTTAGQPVPAGGFAGGIRSGSGASNARSGPASGGTSGTVASVSTSSFAVSTSAGQKVTVDEASSTTYLKGTNSTSAAAITKGEPVLVLGTTSGTTISATQVIVQPKGSASGSSSAAAVVPFQQGAPTTSKQVGQIPANYSQGSGTIVSGAAANKATEAALAAYPGGIVDRVVMLSNGEYEVHNIGVDWPHHIFVSQDFAVVGAD